MLRKLDAKINNSYESEPSSGSVTSERSLFGESNDTDTDYAVIGLPSLLKPRELLTNTCNYPEMSLEPIISSGQQQNVQKDLNFNDTQSKKIDFSHKKQICIEYYNATNEDNSCNAVDMELTNEIRESDLSKISKNIIHGPLSFNGKINSLSHQVASNVQRIYSSVTSPDLFAEDDDEDKEYKKNNETNNHQTTTSADCAGEHTPLQEPENGPNKFQINTQRDWELLRRIKNCLAGVPPPPALTIPQIDILDVVVSHKEAILNFYSFPQVDQILEDSEKPWLFKPTHTIEEIKSTPWREVLAARQHGISFNTSKACESNEMLNLAVIERFIGAETASSYRHSPSSAKKRNSKLKKLMQSPGNRLSHLAKRRAVFSSANLANSLQKTSTSGAGRGLQILLDKKKQKNRRKNTPKRITSSNKKRNLRKTPNSSAKKRLLRCDITKPGPSRESSKRALFQSPAKQIQLKTTSTKPIIKPAIADRVEKSKRALFSPLKSDSVLISDNSLSQSSQSSLFGNLASVGIKRKRNQDDEKDMSSSKNICGNGENLTPRALKIKSQSFCVGKSSAESIIGNVHNGGINSLMDKRTLANGKLFTKACSDTTIASNPLSENHRKKLLWAVSQALQLKSISVNHEHFKQYASVLAKVVKRLFQEFFQKNSSSTSETMLKLAKKHVYCVIAGKGVDDIYLNAKFNIESDLKRMSSLRLSGYIGRDEYEKRKNSLLQNNLNHHHCSMSNLLANENSSDFFDQSQNSSTICSMGLSQQSSSLSEMNLNERMPQDTSLKLQNAVSENILVSGKLPVQPNSKLTNSSSKNNLCGLALRENVDCEQRKSTQKNFTGKDQRNVSPYVQTSTTTVQSKRNNSSIKQSNVSDFNRIIAKAKRQITFDS